MRILFILSIFLFLSGYVQAQEWVCPNPEDTECDLIPDIRLSKPLLQDPTQNPEILGELGVSLGTPNLGHGPLRVVPTDNYICGTDTIFSPGGMNECPDGELPRQLMKQVIYRKVGDVIDTYERDAGTMTYHPTHDHIHVDNWGTYTIREEIEGVDDPREWPIIAEGSKLGFCLMDLETCADPQFEQECEVSPGQWVDPETFPNYGMGGGQFNCAAQAQGISVGFLDIYHYYLDGMQIPIPPDVCNGTYKLVVEADPLNFFLEEDETNNVLAVDVTLTEQNAQPTSIVSVEGPTTLCPGETVELVCTFGNEPLWSNGATTQSILVTEPGMYSVSSATDCVSATSDVIEVVYREVEQPAASALEPICQQDNATITVENATGDIFWYDNAEMEGTPIATGASFETPVLGSTTSYWAVQESVFEGAVENSEPYDNTFGGGAINSPQFNGSLILNVLEPVTLQSATMYADYTGVRTIELTTENGELITSVDVNVPAGENKVEINLDLPVGENLRLGASSSSGQGGSPDLFRSNSNISYPYGIPATVEVTGSTFGDSYYYYYYNMEYKKSDQICVSAAQQVEVIVEPCGVNTEEAYEANSVVVLPNPAKDVIQLQFDIVSAQAVDIQIINMAGQSVYQQQLSAFSGKFDQQIAVDELPEGVYIVEIAKENGKTQKKLILQ